MHGSSLETVLWWQAETLFAVCPQDYDDVDGASGTDCNRHKRSLRGRAKQNIKNTNYFNALKLSNDQKKDLVI